ncbi:acetyltransferase (GNAT) family protein [Herbihabitans rhizosphaerae]|uniref:Acetyltransferase (GNAT) family protein n=1 Tax=Herbihabitans rhizosphaerae TaxID=1872711 RepID=A0A4Q7KJ01_9PSEU|nr:acetyltransferase (GNAT) family protein [Herbihabitans rhizosphaerae]
MTRLASLTAAQTARLTGMDPLLPPVAHPPDGEVITAALPSGERVAGVLARTHLTPELPPSLWSALDVFELHPLLGAHGGDAFDALVPRWRNLVEMMRPGADSSCVVFWPSRDAEVTKSLLHHGFVPLSVIAVRGREPGDEPPPGVTIRRATERDIDTVLHLAMVELAYSAQVGGTVLRPGAARIKRDALIPRLAAGDPMWLAERDGVAIGLAECWLTESEPGSWTATRLPVGSWGYVNCLSVLPDARGAGVGQALMSVAHNEMHRRGVRGTFLYYNPPNPLSSVFWARQGYRPLWTVWEVRPATALR